MTAAAWAQLAFLILLLAISTPLLGRYLARVYGGGAAPGDRIFGPVERLIYRVCGIDAEGEQHWKVYAYSLLAFSFVSLLILYAQIRLQGHLPLNPNHFKGMPPVLAFNTAVSFLTNTNWQNYAGESTAAHPFENPNPLSNGVQIFLILLIPFAFPFAYGRMVGDRKQGYVVVATMFVLWLGTSLAIMAFETAPSPVLAQAGASQAATATQSGGNMEGKEVRFGAATCGLFAG